MQQRQHSLLVELEDKLRLASQYFHQLQGPNGGALEEAAPEALFVVPKKASRRRSDATARKQAS
jgi:hypothetical protein